MSQQSHLHSTQLVLGDLTISGSSTAGMGTSFRVPELGVVFDIGICPVSHASAHHLLLTHGHPDHCGALVAWLGLRALHRMPMAHIYTEAKICDDVRAIVDAAQRMARHPLDAKIVAARPGDVLPLGVRGRRAHAFRAIHRVPTLGWSVVESRKKLREAFRGLAGPEISALRAKGADLFDEIEVPLVTYTGDTRPEVITRETLVRQSRVLLMEASFLDEWKDAAAAKAGGHTHLDELVELAPELQCEHLVVVHLSQRYAPERARQLVVDALQPHVRGTVHAFTRDTNRSPRRKAR